MNNRAIIFVQCELNLPFTGPIKEMSIRTQVLHVIYQQREVGSYFHSVMEHLLQRSTNNLCNRCLESRLFVEDALKYLADMHNMFDTDITYT